MTTSAADTLIERLATLTDSERLEFARWAVDQPAPPAVSLGWGRVHAARVAAERAAAQAFDAFRGDGTVTGVAWDYAATPGPGQVGEREAAVHTVRAMAAALVVGDEAALSRLAPAFAALGLADLTPAGD